MSSLLYLYSRDKTINCYVPVPGDEGGFMLWWVLFKVLAVLMIAFGGFLFIFFPGIPRHQEGGEGKGGTSFGIAGIVIGLVLIIAGGFILFSP